MIKTLYIVIILIIYHSADAKPAETMNKLSYQVYNKAGGYQQSCQYGCKRGLICNQNKCICPDGLQYSSTAESCIECPSDWTIFKGICLKFVENDSFLSWNMARSKCLNIGGDLYDVKPENHFEFMDSYVNYINISTDFFVGVRADENSYLNYTSVFSLREIPADGQIWRCNNLENSFKCRCWSLYDKFDFCDYNDYYKDKTRCPKCSYLDTDLQLNPIDCDNNFNISFYICQRKSVYNYNYVPKNRNNQELKSYQPSTYNTNIRCNLDTNCPVGSICLNYYCVCNYGYHLVDNKCIKCPFGWFYNDGYCYYVSQDRQNWTSAVSYCLEFNSSLISIDRNELSSYPVKLFNLIDSLDLNKPVWVGGVRQSFDYTSNWLYLNDRTIIPLRPWIEAFVSKCSQDSAFYDSLNFDRNVLAAHESDNQLVSYGFEERNNFICQKKLGVDLNVAEMNNIKDTLDNFNIYGQYTDFQQFCYYNSTLLTPLGPNNTFESPYSYTNSSLYQYCTYLIIAPIDRKIVLYITDDYNNTLIDFGVPGCEPYYNAYLYVQDGNNWYAPILFETGDNGTISEKELDPSTGRYLFITLFTFVQDPGTTTFRFRYEFVDNQSPRNEQAGGGERSEKLKDLINANDQKSKDDALKKILIAE